MKNHFYWTLGLLKHSSSCKLNTSLSSITKAIYNGVRWVADKSAVAQEGKQVQAKSRWDHIWDAKVSVSHEAHSFTSKIIFLLNYMCLTTAERNFAKTTFLWETQLQYHLGEQTQFNRTTWSSPTIVMPISWSDHKLF